MTNRFEGDPFDRSEKAKATIAGLAEKLATQTEEEKAASLQAGLDLVIADYRENPHYFDEQQARIDRKPDVVAEREHSESLYRVRRELGYGALGFNPNQRLRSRTLRMAPTEEEVIADKLAAAEAYYDSLPPPVPSKRR